MTITTAVLARLRQYSGTKVLLTVSLCLNAALGMRLIAEHRLQRPGEKGLQPGTSVPSLSVTRLDGAAAMIKYSDSAMPTVIYFFSPSCVWCERNAASIKQLATAAHDRFRLVGVSVSDVGLHDYVETHHLGFPVYSIKRDAQLTAIGFHGTPYTLVISSEGRVLQSWVGAYTGPSKTSLEQFFNVSLPPIKISDGT